GAHASTFGGNPVSCAAAIVTLRLLKERLMTNAVEVGGHLMAGLRGLMDRHPLIGEVRGRGLMVGVELVRDRRTKERAVAARVTVSRARVLFGKSGEDLACGELERRGYAIIARRYRCRSGELDIVARDGPTIVFVEVKTRESREYGEAAESVTWFKRRRMARV